MDHIISSAKKELASLRHNKIFSVIAATIVFPDKFRSQVLLAEIRGVTDVRLWDHIDSDHLCLGMLDWYHEEASSLYLLAEVTLDAFHNMTRLLLDTSSEHRSELRTTAIGLESIEFAERKLRRGVAVTDVSVGVGSRQHTGQPAE